MPKYFHVHCKKEKNTIDLTVDPPLNSNIFLLKEMPHLIQLFSVCEYYLGYFQVPGTSAQLSYILNIGITRSKTMHAVKAFQIYFQIVL